MRRGDATVLSITAVLSIVVVAAVAFSLLVLDRTPSSSALSSENSATGSDSSWLVVTWGPSLCRVDPENLGCASGHVQSLGASWVLHGLWPQPPANQYCGVPEDVADRARKIDPADMPPLQLDEDVRNNLEAKLSDASVMAPHEWYAHGTCSGVDPEIYFGDASALTDQLRRFLDPVFADAQGGRLSEAEVRGAFDERYGAGAGDRVRLTCRNVTGEGSVLYEVQVSLPPVTALRGSGNTLSLEDLLHRGPPIASSCLHGSVP
jgi:ribonuclease T2